MHLLKRFVNKFADRRLREHRLLLKEVCGAKYCLSVALVSVALVSVALAAVYTTSSQPTEAPDVCCCCREMSRSVISSTEHRSGLRQTINRHQRLVDVRGSSECRDLSMLPVTCCPQPLTATCHDRVEVAL